MNAKSIIKLTAILVVGSGALLGCGHKAETKTDEPIMKDPVELVVSNIPTHRVLHLGTVSRAYSGSNGIVEMQKYWSTNEMHPTFVTNHAGEVWVFPAEGGWGQRVW